jgi:hypothetical protein
VLFTKCQSDDKADPFFEQDALMLQRCRFDALATNHSTVKHGATRNSHTPHAALDNLESVFCHFEVCHPVSMDLALFQQSK